MAYAAAVFRDMGEVNRPLPFPPTSIVII